MLLRSSKICVLAVLLSVPAWGQGVNPVYVDDSPVARETLSRVGEFEVAGNESEAVRELQRLLDEQADRLVAEPGQNNLFVSVRTRVHRKLLSSPKLLERYRIAETARAQKELSAPGGGWPERVEKSRLLTAPGFEAALRVAQSHLEAAEFEAARQTLAQLRDHPDRKTSKLNKNAAQLMSVVARYCPRPEVWEMADQWCTEAGVPVAARAPIDPPPSLRQPKSDFMSGAQKVDPSGVPNRPLWSSPIDPPGTTGQSTSEEFAPEDASHNLFILPTVVGDSVYVNDGTYITARDRFTLQPRWTLKPHEDDIDEESSATRRAGMGRGGPRIDDTCTVSVQGRVLVATTGLSQSGSREGAGRTYALDTATGRVLWSFALPDLDPVLEGASIRGPALVEGSTVVVVARKGSQGRRMTQLYLIAVSLDSGMLKWVRPIGSAGALPFRGIEQRTDRVAVLHQGVVYCADRLGILAGVEAATGRPLWIRRMPVAAANGIGFAPMPEPTPPWTWDSPIINGSELVTLSPDRQEVLLLDRLTGVIKAKRLSPELGSPSYLLRIGDRLAGVTGDSICLTPMADVAHGIVTTTRTFGSPGIRGRVMVSGDKLLVPRVDGVAVIDPTKPNVDETVMRLERSGNVLPLENQLLVTDATMLHSFVTWDIAQRLLSERMAGSPNDPEPAITYAELAYRSQHPDQIAAAVDKAIASIDRNPAAEPSRLARQRLFDVLRDMVEASQASWGQREPAPPPRTAPAPQPYPRRRQPGVVVASKPAAIELPVLSPAQLAPVIGRWGRIAQTPDERAAHLMALGRLCEAQGQPGLAADAYQRVLGDRRLAAASWKRSGIAVRAEIEATRRTRQIVFESGPAVYAAFEAQAAQELAALGPGATSDDLERLARQYPAAGIAATMWARAADIHDRSGKVHLAILTLREGLAAAEAAQSAGSNLESNMIGEIGGRLAVRLQKLDQVFAAAQLVSRIRAQHPDVKLLDHGTVINADSLASDLMSKLADLRRLPRIGPEVQPNPQALVGWRILHPRSKEQLGKACEHVMLISSSESKVALWGIAGPGGAEPGAAPIQQLWSRPYLNNRPPILYRIDPDSVFLYWEEGPEGAVMERINTVDGETRWKSEPFRSLFGPDPAFDQRLQITRNVIDTPVDGAVKMTDIALTMDEQVLAMVERSGRVAAFDPLTGKLLWKGQTAVQQVHDADAGGGTLVIAGQSMALAGGPGGAGGGMENLIAVVDARTGALVHRLDQLAGRARWVRVAGGRFPAEAARSVLVAGLDTEITSFDLERGKTNWTIPGNQTVESQDAWIFGDRLFILSDNRSMWLASLSTGKLNEQPMETFEHLVGSGMIQGMAIGGDFLHTSFATTRGVCLFDEHGRLIGIDALQGGEADEGGLLPPAAGQDYFITVETTAGDTPATRSLYNIHTLDTRSAMLKTTRQLSLELPPTRIALLDGRVLITAGMNTIVYAAPEVDN